MDTLHFSRHVSDTDDASLALVNSRTVVQMSLIGFIFCSYCSKVTLADPVFGLSFFVQNLCLHHTHAP